MNLQKIDSLGKDNYETWRVLMEALLDKIDGTEFVDGSNPRPIIPAEDPDNPETKAIREKAIAAAGRWDKTDRKVRAEIILTISPSEINPSIRACKTSRELWLKLDSIYQSKGPARKAHLLKQLTLHRIPDGEDVREHLARFFETVDKLMSMQVDIHPDLLTIMLLNSLPESFENFKCAIETRDDLPTPENLKIKIIEQWESRQNKCQDPNAMVANKKKWHNSKKNEGFKGKCGKCHTRGHKASECPQVKDKGKPKESLFTNSAEAALKTSSYSWCLDSGCSSHMCGEKSRFTKIGKSDATNVNLADHSSTVVEGKGAVKASVRVGKGIQNLQFEETLYVPNLRSNLLSVGKITDRGHSVTFTKSSAVVRKQDGKVLMVAKRLNGLYYVEDNVARANAAESEKKSNSKLEMWHKRFGHLNEADLKDLCKNKKVIGVDLSGSRGLPDCTVCVQGKMSQRPFPKHSNRNSRMLEIIHTDLCGPMRVESNGKKKYVLTLIDDYSRWCEVRFLHSKSDVLEEFKKYKTMVETQKGKKIKMIQSDNGTEYVNKKFDRYLESCGIQRRLTVPHTPQQNGVAERKNRSLIETARCLMIQSKVSPSFWAEAVNTANHIRNRCPSKGTNGETPYKLWNGKIPNVKYFRVFGSKVLFLDKELRKGKFASRSKEGIFIGYSEETKGYRVWSKEDRKVVISRDVKFLNDFGESSENSDTNSFLPENLFDSEKTKSKVLKRDILIGEPFKTASIEEATNESLGREEEQTALDPQDNPQPDDKREWMIVRGRGRPRTIRTGRRGRPRKVYSENRILVQDKPSSEEINSEYDGTVDEEFAGLVNLRMKEVFSREDGKLWREAVQSEYSSIIENKTFKIVDRPKDKNVIGSRVVLCEKLKADGTVERKKARLVAKGYNQRQGEDFNETFAPVVRMSTIRTLMALAVEHDLEIHQLDVTTAFLNGDLTESIFMDVPENFEEILNDIVRDEKSLKQVVEDAKEMLESLKNTNKGSKVCLLQKSLYGLKQAGRQWYLKLDENIKKLGLKPLKTDPCLYYCHRGKDTMLLSIYVDDLWLASGNPKWIKEMKENLMKTFKMKYLGKIHYGLGIEFHQDRNEGKIFMSQRKYTQDILRRFGMENSKPVSTPIEVGMKLKKPEVVNVGEKQTFPYQRLIGSLMYLAVSTRPDIAYAVNSLSQFNTCYTTEHWVAAKRVLRYLKGTPEHGILFQKTGKPLHGHADADWASCAEDRRSYSGYFFTLGGAAVTWEARKQRTVALSSVEAEYLALSEATKEALYLRQMLGEIGLSQPKSPIQIDNDNQGAQLLAKNSVHHSRTKHIDVRHHFIRNCVAEDIVALGYVPTAQMPADVLTKGLPRAKHQEFTKELGVQRNTN